MCLGSFDSELVYASREDLGYNVKMTTIDMTMGKARRFENLSRPESLVFFGVTFNLGVGAATSER